MAIAIREIQQRSFLPEVEKRIMTTFRGMRRLANTKEEKIKELLKAGGQMQPKPPPMRKSGDRETIEKVKEERKKEKK